MTHSSSTDAFGSPEPSPVVSLVGVRFGYGSRIILDDLDLAVGRGESLALVGRSGAGKTTVLKLINRLLLPSTGSVVVEGRDTRSGIRFVCAGESVTCCRKSDCFRISRSKTTWRSCRDSKDGQHDRRRSRAHELLELVGLSPNEFAARWPRELSGGQRQRVGVARALAIDPPILLMDEPFGALDQRSHGRNSAPSSSASAVTCARRSILVTHDMDEAFALGDRVGVSEGGRVIFRHLTALTR